MNDDCPKCGTRLLKTEGGIDGRPVHYWACGSDDDGDFYQWDACRIIELESQLDAANIRIAGLEGEIDAYEQYLNERQ